MLNSKNTLAIILAISIVMGMFLSINYINAANIDGDNYKNVTVHTQVNITNSRPMVLNVTVYQETNFSMNNITLNAGMTRTVTCNATVRDWNGHGDVAFVNASIWHTFTALYSDADDNNTHYTNISCTKGTTTGLYDAEYICEFAVYYYANNGTWNCNVTANDNFNKTGSLTNSTNLYPLYALNVTDGIDYGNMQVDDTSIVSVEANVTNFGNMAINISLEGYGTTRGDNLAMVCDTFGNITVDNERFSLDSGTAWASMTNLTSTPELINSLTMPKQNITSTQVINSTFWRLYIPPNPAGNCTGFIIFSAEAP